MEKRVLKHLVRSLDSALRKKDRKRLDRALAESKRLRLCRDEILSLRQAVSEGAERSFRTGFEDRVISRIRSAPAVPNKLKALIESHRWVNRLAAISVIILIVLIAVALVQDGLIPKDAVFYVSDTTISRILQVPVL